MKGRDILSELKEKLTGLYPDRELESISGLIAEHVTGMNGIQFQIAREEDLTDAQADDVRLIISRLALHEPIQYILGETEFYGLRIKVKPGVLIPRGETEELVEWVVKGMGAQGHKGTRILDIGCGSGAIAIALAKNLPDYEVVAADISDAALSVTAENALINQVALTTTHLDILQSSSFAFPLSPFAIIVSNPPYIPLAEKQSMAGHVTGQEPDIALFVPDEDPLVFYRAIAAFARLNLTPGGQLFVEVHDRLGDETAELFRGFFSQVELRKDIHGKDRMIRAANG